METGNAVIIDALSLLEDHIPETQPLAEELLEASESVFHRDVAKFQVNQSLRFRKEYQEAIEWGKAEINKQATCRSQIEFIVQTHLEKIRAGLSEETDRYMEITEKEWEERDGHIIQWLTNHHEGE